MKIVVKNIFMCLVLFWKCYFPTNSGSKLRQSKATTTKTPPPHHHNNNKNQNHTEIKITQRERSVGRRSVGRRRDRAEARSKARSSDAVRSAQCCDRRDQYDLVRAIVGLELTRSSGAVRLARCCDRRDRCDLVRAIAGLELGVRRQRRRHDLGSLFFLSRARSLSLYLCASNLEMIWIENFHFKPFPGSKPHFTQSTSNNFWKIYFPCATKHPHLRKSISRSDLKPKQTQPK